MNILIHRNDNLGDIIYTLHLAGLLKKHYPNSHICFLVRRYAAPLFEYAKDVDDVLIWEEFHGLPFAHKIKHLKSFDVFINARAQAGMACLSFCAGIKTRIGSARRWCNFLFCNKRINIIRKGSPKHEVDFNAQLLTPLINETNLSTQTLFDYIKLEPNQIPTQDYDLPKNKTLVICHPSSNGNGREWPIDNFINLINTAAPNIFHFILTGSPSEKRQADIIEAACHNVTNFSGKFSLSEFIAFISQMDILIASGTGPLHIAAALGIKTIGLFPPIHALDSKRWGPKFKNATNIETQKSCLIKCSNEHCPCLAEITASQVAEVLNKIKEV